MQLFNLCYADIGNFVQRNRSIEVEINAGERVPHPLLEAPAEFTTPHSEAIHGARLGTHPSEFKGDLRGGYKIFLDM